jgi:peptide/nickel transport system substrate-binding protein
MKKTFPVLVSLLILAGLVLSACQGARPQAGGETTSPTFVVYAVNSEPLTNWDPAIEFSNGIHVMNNIYEQLVRYDPVAKKDFPLLAESYSVSDDGLTWTFNLRQNVKFQNGDDFTAEDVKFSIERTMRVGAGASYIWYAVDQINVVDPHTVEFKLAFQTPLNLVAATGYAAFIYSSKCVNDQDEFISEAKGCGTGPYMLQSARWGDEVILEKFDGYWRGWPEKNYSKAIIRKVAEPATRRQMIESGEAQITVELPFTDVEAIKNNPNLVVNVESSLQNLYAMFNTEKAPTDNVLVRQALTYAFPFDQVIQYAAGGYASQSYGAVPQGLWGFSTSLPQYSYDLEKARQLLDQAGLSGGFKLLLTYTAGNESEKTMAELYKAELAKLNIDLEIRGMPWDSQWELGMNSDPQARQDIFVMYWWPDLPSPYSFLFSPFHSEDEVLFNLAYYKNPVYDDIIDEANELTSMDPQKSEQMFVDAQRILLEDAATIFVYDRQDVWVVSNKLQGFKFNSAYPTTVFFYETSPVD